MRYGMKYGVLEECPDFIKLKQVFGHGMLRYFQNQLENYLNGESDEHPDIVCWYSGTMTTEEFIIMCSDRRSA